MSPVSGPVTASFTRSKKCSTNAIAPEAEYSLAFGGTAAMTGSVGAGVGVSEGCVPEDCEVADCEVDDASPVPLSLLHAPRSRTPVSAAQATVAPVPGPRLARRRT